MARGLVVLLLAWGQLWFDGFHKNHCCLRRRGGCSFQLQNNALSLVLQPDSPQSVQPLLLLLLLVQKNETFTIKTTTTTQGATLRQMKRSSSFIRHFPFLANTSKVQTPTNTSSQHNKQAAVRSQLVSQLISKETSSTGHKQVVVAGQLSQLTSRGTHKSSNASWAPWRKAWRRSVHEIKLSL